MIDDASLSMTTRSRITEQSVSPIDLQYIGSFQNGFREWSESPLDDLWKRIALFGYPGHLNSIFKMDGSQEAKAGIEAYAATRLRQCIEFRAAYHASTLLTAPLPLYYAFLNLTRAFLALQTERLPAKKTHGLAFGAATSVLESTATIRDGTFSEWLTALGSSATERSMTLRECLSYIVEIGHDYSAVLAESPRVVPVHVHAMLSGAVALRFDAHRVGGEEAFRTNWEREYPSLAKSCALDDVVPCALRVKAEIETSSHEAIAQFCQDHLEVNLVPSDHPTWYLLGHGSAPPLPRASYYLCAAFILSNVTRYEPESLMKLLSEPSSTAWLLERFLTAAERFYPNLVLNWIAKQNWFFGTA